jgi:uncharacterized protein YjdB
MTTRFLMALSAALVLTACSDRDPAAPLEEKPVARVAIDEDSTTLDVGRTMRLTARTYAPDGSELVNRPVGWSSTNETVATVTAGGVVTSVGAGSVTIRATSGSRSDSVVLQVRLPHVPVAMVKIQPDGQITLPTGTSRLVLAFVRAANDSLLTDRAVAWSTRDAQVVTVSAAGWLTAAAPGTTWIVAVSEGRADSVEVHVPAPPAAVARVVPATDGLIGVMLGETTQLAVRVFAADDTELFGRPVTWSSSNPGIASVSAGGHVVAREFGVATVTATVEGVSAQVAIDVRSPVAQVHVTATPSGIAVGDEVQATVMLRSANGSVVQRPVTWTSSNPAVAEVDANGKVRGRAGGSALIVATSDNQQGWIEIRVGEWTSHTLQDIGGEAPPAELWSIQNANGTTTTVTAQSGSLRLAMIHATSGRFEQRFDVLITTGSSFSVGSFIFGGTYTYHSGTGTLTLSSYSGETLDAELLPGGGIRVTGRLEAGRPVQTFLYAPLH